ncbi:MAG: metal ABC transporter ATP-binding protein [Ruminococcaceae bacterium]|nr:metal ABC transporter ATP-binding protein [Oscillospiraceae bacterium]
MLSKVEQTTIISTEDLSFYYGRTPVFSRVSFSMQPGDFAAVIGANGTGKSTLVKLLLGQLKPATGRIHIFGQEQRQFHEWWRVGYLPQGHILTAQSFPATALELVQTGLYPQIGFMRFARRQHREQVRQALEMVGMEQIAGKLVGQLSGGQQQRVMLARVLVARPQLMILDEPATGIDERSAASLYSLLSELNKERKLTILMITHDVARVQSYLSRVFCLESGSLIELSHSQLVDELGHRHKHPVNPECVCCDPMEA